MLGTPLVFVLSSQASERSATYNIRSADRQWQRWH